MSDSARATGQVFISIFVTFSSFPVLAFMYVPQLVIVFGVLLSHMLPYSITSLATLSAALTFALCLAFVFSTGVSLLLGKSAPDYTALVAFLLHCQAASSLPPSVSFWSSPVS
jgi:hypothetical protein